MSGLALSPTATTGLFTLLGTMIGAVIGGGLTLILEMLRRHWKLQDAIRDAAIARDNSRLQERKAVYPKFLAKSNELDYLNANFELPEISRPSVEEVARTGVYEIFSRIWPIAGKALQEFEDLRAQVDIIADEPVRMLAKDLDAHLVEHLVHTALYGHISKSDSTDHPYHKLIQAMRIELGFEPDS